METDRDTEQSRGICGEGSDYDDISTESDTDIREITRKRIYREEEEAETKAVESKAKKPKLQDRSINRLKSTILKKSRELATICDVPVCVGIMSPKGTRTTDTWPEARDSVKSMLDGTNFKNEELISGEEEKISVTSRSSSRSLKIVDDHDEIMNALNSKIALVEERISFLQSK